MQHAEICPVCKGSGIYCEYVDYVHTTGPINKRTCHGCSGKGWITVPDSTPLYRHPDLGPEIIYNSIGDVSDVHF